MPRPRSATSRGPCALSAPLYFGRAVDDVCQFVSGQFAWMIEGLDADIQARALDALRVSVADHHTDRGVC
ncbi:MAG: hypothetical protein ACRDTC_22645 [Pseudonocardiaceae bacterium]